MYDLLYGFRCGLAEQLDRLLSRQRSEKALWHHQMLRQQRHHGNEQNTYILCIIAIGLLWLTPVMHEIYVILKQSDYDLLLLNKAGSSCDD